MPYDPKHKILFVHIPKTGGTSIERFFDFCHAENFWFDRWDRNRDAFVKLHRPKCSSSKLVYEPQHYPVEVLKNLIDDYDDYFKFTFVRNPYTKLLSEYFWRENKHFATHDDFDPEHFDFWCKVMLADLNNSHKEPQVNFIDHTVGFIGRFERLEADFNVLLELLEKKSTGFSGYRNKTLPVIHSTGLDKSSIIPYILRKTKKRIIKTYKQDFKRFNYDHQLR